MQSPPRGENAATSPVIRRDRAKLVSVRRCCAYVAPDKRRLCRRARFLPEFGNRLLATRRPAHRVLRARPQALVLTEAAGLERAGPEQASSSDKDCVLCAMPIHIAGR